MPERLRRNPASTLKDMSLLHWALWAAAAATNPTPGHVVSEDASPVRSSCDSGATVVATAQRGERAQILFAISGDIGTCYKVNMERADGTRLQGYLPAKSLAGIESFERARRAASALDGAGSGATAAGGPAAAPPPPPAPVAVAKGQEQIDKAQDLLANGQAVEALELLEQVVKLHPKHAGVQLLAGYAAYQADQPKSAARYLAQSLEIEANPQAAALLAKVKQEINADVSSQKLVGTRFNFRYDDATVTPDQARSLLPVLDAEFTRVAEVLGCRAEERITAVIQAPRDYYAATGAAEWSGGVFDGRIRVALLEAAPGEKTRQLFAHEIVHACLARTGRWPGWLHEGLAQKLAGQQVPPAARARVKSMARSGELPPLQQMGKTFSGMNAENASVAYAAALLAAEQLLDAFGPAGVRSLLQNPASLQRVAADLDQRLKE